MLLAWRGACYEPPHARPDPSRRQRGAAAGRDAEREIGSTNALSRRVTERPYPRRSPVGPKCKCPVSPGGLGRSSRQSGRTLRRVSASEGLSRAAVQFGGDRVEMRRGVRGEVRALGKYRRSRPFAFSLEPRCHGHAGRRSRPARRSRSRVHVLGHFLATIPRQGAPQLRGSSWILAAKAVRPCSAKRPSGKLRSMT